MQSFRVRVGTRGRVTIPKPIREALGIGPGTILEVSATESAIVMRVVRPMSRKDSGRR